MVGLVIKPRACRAVQRIETNANCELFNNNNDSVMTDFASYLHVNQIAIHEVASHHAIQKLLNFLGIFSNEEIKALIASDDY